MRNTMRVGAVLGGVVLAAVPAQAIAAPASAVVPCQRGVGNEAALARAFQAGGRIELAHECTYTVTRQHGKNSALPAVTRDTTILGHDSTIAWGGRSGPRTLIELAGRPRVTFVMEDLRLQGGPGMATLRIRRHTSASISNSSGGGRVSKKYNSHQHIGGRALGGTGAGEPAPPSGGPVRNGNTESAPADEGGYDASHLVNAEENLDQWLPALLNGPLGGALKLRELLGGAEPERGGQNGTTKID